MNRQSILARKAWQAALVIVGGFATTPVLAQTQGVPDYAPPGYEPRAVQTAPAEPEYRPNNETLPEYVQDGESYYIPSIGPQPYADYAPQGYQEREFQDAPGAAEFTPLTPPARVSSAERGSYVTGGFAPGSYLAPGTNTSFRLRGFVRLGALYDFDPIGSRDDFVTNTIPVPQESGQNYNMSARFSRFALETWTPTDVCDWNVHTFIEGDFFNGPAQAVGGGGNPFRLRFAFVDFGYFRFGQQNSVFMDASSFPMTVDFAGPRGLVNLRRSSFRMTLPLTDNIYWATGVEQPFSDITTGGAGVNVQDVPDLATHLRFQGEYGSHVQIAALYRELSFRPTGGEVLSESAWGMNLTTNLHPWAIIMGTDPVREENPSGLTRSRILLQGAFGHGIGRYIQDTAGLGLDGQVDPLTDEFSILDATGWSASYEHWFNRHWLSNTTYSEAAIDSAPGQPGTTYDSAKYLASSIWYIPIPNMSLGMEFVWGERENIDGQNAHAQRLQALFQYNF